MSINNNLPSLLYRGITLLRWKIAQYEGKIDAVTNGQDGYIYFTNYMRHARLLGLTRYIRDIRDRIFGLNEDFRYIDYYDKKPHLRYTVALALDTNPNSLNRWSKTYNFDINNFELDPEQIAKVTQPILLPNASSIYLGSRQIYNK